MFLDIVSKDHSVQLSGVQARPLRLKKNLSPLRMGSEKILGEKISPATFLLISTKVG